MVLASVATALILLAGVDASALRSTVFHGERMSEAELRQTLLDEIEGAYGTVNQRGRLISIEAALKGTYTALPKNEFGKLGHQTVRYALHRLFVQRHGWHIKGLEPHVQRINASSPTGVLKEQVPAYVEQLFEERLGAAGFSLHDTAVLAATIEHLIHNEAEGRLLKAYNSTGLSTSADLDSTQLDALLDTYMKHYILTDLFLAGITDEQMLEIFPGWRETQGFVRDVTKEFSTGYEKKFVYTRVLEIVEELGERYGRLQDSECKFMKARLMALGDNGVGRIPLHNFYSSSMDETAFEFQESPQYLSTLGALDDQQQVIIPNYLGSMSNCIASSNLYSVCCINECEALMSSLEQQVGAPEASPEQIAALVSKLPSSTVEAPRELPQDLVQRLSEIAAQHEGAVQLHGRLFAQWLHHAFPRECPFPHIGGSISPITPDEWMAVHGSDDFIESKEGMAEHSKRSSELERTEELVHWIDEEELLAPRPQRRSKASSTLAFAALALALASMAINAVASAKPITTALAVLRGNQGAVTLPIFSEKRYI